jgi:hypothetical protein
VRELHLVSLTDRKQDVEVLSYLESQIRCFPKMLTRALMASPEELDRFKRLTEKAFDYLKREHDDIFPKKTTVAPKAW